MGILAKIAFWVLLVSAVSCKTQKLVSEAESTTRTDTTIFTPKVVDVVIPGDSIKLADNVAKEIHYVYLKDSTKVPCIVIDTTTKEVSSGSMTMKIKLDSLANVTATASVKEKWLEIKLLEKERIIKEYKERVSVYEERETMFFGIIKKIGYIVAGIVVLGLILSFVLSLIRKGLLG